MDRLLLDFRLAVRRLLKNPAFSLIAISTLALGIGANTAIFSAINAVLLRPLPVDRPSELISVNETLAGDTYPTLSYPNYLDIRDRNQVLTGLVAYRFLPVSLGLAGSSQRVWGYLVTGNYFQVLGVNAIQGRAFEPTDDIHRGGHPVAVLSYGCWQKRFGGDPGAVGRTVKFNGMDFTILGVAPRGFFGTELYFNPDVFFPMAMQQRLEGGNGYLDNRADSNTFIVGRRKPGVSLVQAEAGLNSIAHQLAEEHPKDNGGMKLKLTPPGLAGNYIRGAVIGFAAILFGVSTLVLLLACTNLASLLLARAADRRKETAIRLALGAERGRLIRQLLTENLVVSLLGGAGGALIALWVTSALAAWRLPIDIPILMNVTPDARVFFFALLVSVGTTLLFGLLPAMQSTKTDLVPALKNEAASEKLRHWHLRDYMVTAQVALCALLLVCSVLVVKSLRKALDAPIGYNPKGAVTASFDLNIQGYDEARGRAFQRQVLERVRAIPGIESAAMIDFLPLTLNSSSDSIFIVGKPKPKPSEAPTAFTYSVSPGYFAAMQTRLLSGREFDARDKQGGQRVAIVNQTFAERLLHGEDPLGKQFTTGPDGKPITIVGVAQDGKYFSLSETPKPAFWTPLEIWYSGTAAVVARTKMDGASALQQIRNVVRDLDPSLSLFGAGTMVQQLDVPLFPARIAATALGAFGLLALVLAATGIYGVMAYAVSRRTREIGIRMAIGASQPQVFGMVARHAVILVGSGTVLGLGAALVIGRLLGQILYGVEPTDPLSFLIVLSMMLAIAALACWIPTYRAIHINPIRALREE